MTVGGRRKYQAKRDWVGYQRVREKNRNRASQRPPMILVDTGQYRRIIEHSSSNKRGTVSELVFITDSGSEISFEVETNTPVKEVQFLEENQKEMINVLESDGDFVSISRSETQPLAE